MSIIMDTIFTENKEKIFHLKEQLELLGDDKKEERFKIEEKLMILIRTEEAIVKAKEIFNK